MQIKFSIINIWQGYEYASSSENTSVTQGSLENSLSYMFDRFLSIPWSLSLQGLEYIRVVNMPRLHMVLGKLYFKDSQYFEYLGFWICQGFECIRSLNRLCLRVLDKILLTMYLTGFWIYHGFKICQGSEYVRILNISGLIKKILHHIDAWHGSDYSSGSAYNSLLNMPGLQKVV